MPTTYKNLQDHLIAVTNRGDITAPPLTLIAPAINWALNEIQRHHNFRCMRTMDEQDMEIGEPYYELPVPNGFQRFKEMISVKYLSTDNKLQELWPLEADQLFSHSVVRPDTEEIFDLSDPIGIGLPVFWGEEEGAIILRPAPDTVYPIEFRFYAFLDDLADDTDHNELTDEYPEAVLFQSMARIFEIVSERDLAGDYAQLAAGAFNSVRREQTLSKLRTLRRPGDSPVRIPG